MNKKKVNKILKENKEYFDAFEHYDETGEWLLGRKRIDVTLDYRVVRKLKEMKKKTGKSVSRIIEDCVKENC